MKIKKNQLWVMYNVEENLIPELDTAIREVVEKHGFKFIGSGYGEGFDWGCARDMQFERKADIPAEREG